MSNVSRETRIVALALAAVPAACGSATPTAPSDLTGAAWRLQSIQTSSSTIAIARPDNFTITFSADQKLGIKADCNVCGGTYALSGGTLQLNGIFCTLAYCGDASHDRAYMDVLTNVTSVAASGNELIIGSTKGVARFTR